MRYQISHGPTSKRRATHLCVSSRQSSKNPYHTEKNLTVWVPLIYRICQLDLCVYYRSAFAQFQSPVYKLIRSMGIRAAELRCFRYLARPDPSEQSTIHRADTFRNLDFLRDQLAFGNTPNSSPGHATRYPDAPSLPPPSPTKPSDRSGAFGLQSPPATQAQDHLTTYSSKSKSGHGGPQCTGRFCECHPNPVLVQILMCGYCK